jgi:D-alanyl-D-alanine dipeptidase
MPERYLDEACPQMINFAPIIFQTMRLIVFTVSFLISTLLSGQEKPVVVISDTLSYLEQIDKNPNTELVNLENFVPGLKSDIRFALKNNPTGETLYANTGVFVRRPLAVSLGIIQEALNRRGFGLLIFDAYRPYAVAKEMVAQTKNSNDEKLFENSLNHSRGASVDVSLISLSTGEEIQMPTDYCQNNPAAKADFQDLPDNVLENRNLLIELMQKHGFRVNPKQWWHFDFMGWQAFSLMDLSFEELEIINKNMN